MYSVYSVRLGEVNLFPCALRRHFSTGSANLCLYGAYEFRGGEGS